MNPPHRVASCLLALILLCTAPLVQADDWTSAGGVTTTPDPVGIGLAPPLAAQLHVVSTSNNSIMQLHGPSGAKNGVPEGVLFTDTFPTEGYCCGVVMNLTGNSIIRIGHLQIGQWGTALLQSTNGGPLILNGSAVTGSPAGDVVVGYNGQQIGLRILAVGNSSFAGKLGVGTSSPGNLFTVNQPNDVTASAPSSYGLALYNQNSADFGIGSDAAYTYLQTWNTKPLQVNNQGNNVIFNLAGGNVGIGTAPAAGTRLDVSGNLNVSGTATVGLIHASYQDVAEWVPSGQRLPPGVVVTINAAKNNEVAPSSRAYDTAVAGVVSAQPGVLLGEEGASKSQIATTGRVLVRVDAMKHAIIAGDLLVTADKPGLAMYSEPVDVGGIKIHRPGTIIGKALEPLASGQGEILVLLSLQ